jgi:hypothetical protein
LDVVTNAQDALLDWPKPRPEVDPLLERDASLAALDEAGRTGLLVENEPSAS